jgi:23S rRNA (uracil1939-C5)-methyltransferase
MEGEIVVTLTGMNRSGAAVANAGAQRLVVPGGIPGERVRVRPVRPLGTPDRHPRRESSLAEIVAVEEPSPNRVEPRCRHAAACGGCAWQHIAYPEQLRRKAAALEVQLRRAMGKGAPRVSAMVGMPAGGDGTPWRFRQKAAFVFGRGPDGLVMGHFARGTNDVVPVEECPVHAARANRIAFALRDALAGAGITAAGVGMEGLARHVVVRTSRDESEAVAMLVATRDDPALQAPLRALLDGPEKPEGLVVNVHDRPGPYLVGRESRRVAGPGHVREDSLGPAFLVSPTSFFQTNVAAAATLVRLAIEALPGDSGLRVLDLYSGGGLFALPIALRGHAVTAVEGSRKGTRDAELNRRQNGLSESRLKLVCASVEQALPRLPTGAFDAVILDPPRDGCPPEVVREVFGRLRPARGILVSCNPEALARELPLAVEAGYRILRLQPVDMFPHTPHVEAVAVLVRETGKVGFRTRGGGRPPGPSSRPPSRAAGPTPAPTARPGRAGAASAPQAGRAGRRPSPGGPAGGGRGRRSG